MKNEQLKIIVESLIDTTEEAGKKTIELHNSGLKVIIGFYLYIQVSN